MDVETKEASGLGHLQWNRVDGVRLDPCSGDDLVPALTILGEVDRHPPRRVALEVAGIHLDEVDCSG
jgi:hypothetical protein